MQRPKTLKEIIPHNLKARREALGMSQAELARRAKVTPRYISVLESKPRNLTLETIESLCRVLGVSVCDMICDRSDITKSRRVALEVALDLIERELKAL